MAGGVLAIAMERISRNVMKVLITGGSGFLGINSGPRPSRQRHIRDHRPRHCRFRLSRREGPGELCKGRYPGPRRRVRGACPGQQGIIVHAAAALPLYSRKDIFSTEVDGIRLLLDAALKSGADRFIHISSTAVYGIPDHHPLYESDRLEGVGPYGQAKILAEDLCRTYRATRPLRAHPAAQDIRRP